MKKGMSEGNSFRDNLKDVFAGWLQAELGWPQDAARESAADLADLTFGALDISVEVCDLDSTKWILVPWSKCKQIADVGGHKDEFRD